MYLNNINIINGYNINSLIKFLMNKKNIFTCASCSYNTNTKCNYDKHIESIKHKNNIINNNNFYCSVCNYNSCNKTDYEKHNETMKHKKLVDLHNIDSFICRKCNKHFCSKNTLNRHNKAFHQEETEPPIQNNNIIIDKELLMTVINYSQEFKTVLIEQNNKFFELAKYINNNNTNTNSHNTNTNSHNKFNLNFFLNEQCKNAVNMTDFINSLEVDLKDLEYVGTNGFVHGITSIIMKHINKLDIFTRPIHCTDIKREVIHIRDDNKWEKDDNNQKIKKMVEKVATKNYKKIALWQDVTEESKILDSNSYKFWLEIINQSILSGDREKINIEKVIKNIANNVFIDKTEGII